MSGWTRGAVKARTDCGKPGYTRPDAEARARRMRQRTDEVLTAYHCPRCRPPTNWHVGHNRDRT